MSGHNRVGRWWQDPESIRHYDANVIGAHKREGRPHGRLNLWTGDVAIISIEVSWKKGHRRNNHTRNGWRAMKVHQVIFQPSVDEGRYRKERPSLRHPAFWAWASSPSAAGRRAAESAGSGSSREPSISMVSIRILTISRRSPKRRANSSEKRSGRKASVWPARQPSGEMF